MNDRICSECGSTVKYYDQVLRIVRTKNRTTKWMPKDDIGRKNPEGYSDPTAYEALKNLERDEERFHKLLDSIFTICDLADFHIEGRITVKDKRTGHIWR